MPSGDQPTSCHSPDTGTAHLLARPSPAPWIKPPSPGAYARGAFRSIYAAQHAEVGEQVQVGGDAVTVAAPALDCLVEVPLMVIQGRYVQICKPEVAMRVYRAWPGSQKLLVPFNGGHWGFKGPDKETRVQAGLDLSNSDEERFSKAIALHFGNHRLLNGAAIDCLAISSSHP